ncbi:MAG TPA: RNA methyltransferase [Candidatus Magasanikbacteria bacterium]|nr:RNA methyltransferase [Candidatus Magasanikbacteria bacterium]
MLSKSIIQHINKLGQKKVRSEECEFIIEGVKGVGEALESDLEVLLLVVEGNRRDEKDLADLIKLAENRDVPVEFCGRKEVDDIKTTDTFPGVLAIVEQSEIELGDLEGNIICLDGVKDPGNLGTIIRTADWFGIKNIILAEDCVDPYNPKVVRSTMGSIFRVNIFESEKIVRDLEHLKKAGYKLNGLVMNGTSLDKLKPGKNEVYILGSESHGIRPEVEKLLDKKYTIPGSGNAESLNVAVATGILLSKII